VLRLVVLGAAAGGGFPQWNGNDAAARRARSGDPKTPFLTQSSIAVSADDRRWVVFNASPDIRQQINEREQLQPKANDPPRASPIAAVVLTNADVDHVAGLLSLRESQPLAIYGHSRVLQVLAQNSIFKVLHPQTVPRRELPLDAWLSLCDPAGRPLGVSVRPFAVPGKVALWLEETAGLSLGGHAGDTVGMEIRAETGGSFFYVPGCAAVTAELAARLRGAGLVLFDGTLWRDDEMIAAGVGQKTGKRMGHMSCSGPDGSIAALAELEIERKIFIHMNNTNPLLVADSAERGEARQAGWETAYDGMEIVL
jgi:pyrroloquinoline quinone biosynthesis protein B